MTTDTSSSAPAALPNQLAHDAASIAVEIAQCDIKQKPVVLYVSDFASPAHMRQALQIAITANCTEIPLSMHGQTTAYAWYDATYDSEGRLCIEPAAIPAGPDVKVLTSLIEVELPASAHSCQQTVPVGEIASAYELAVASMRSIDGQPLSKHRLVLMVQN